MVEHPANIYKALGMIISTDQKKKRKRKEEREEKGRKGEEGKKEKVLK